METTGHLLRYHVAALLLTFCCIVLLTSCTKDPYKDGEPVLPPVTMEGKNTLGFLLDGKVWVPYNPNPGLFTPTMEFYMDRTVLGGEARLIRGKETNQQINLTLDVKNGEDTYYFKKGYIGFEFFNNKKTGESCNIYKNHTDDSYVKITKLDWASRIISGTFEFPMMVSDCQDTVSITNGRFDLKL